MSLLTQALRQIDYWINNSQSWHANHIRTVYKNCPGLERDIIDLYSEEFKFKFSEEVYELYQWHDGGMLLGDMANPVIFSSLENSINYLIRDHVPCRPYMPLFIGDEAYYVITEASCNNQTSSILFFDGNIFPGPSVSSRGRFHPRFYAPSITCLMQAVAECAKTHDGISAEYMLMDDLRHEVYLDHTRHSSIFTEIYKKYGVTGDSSGLWR